MSQDSGSDLFARSVQEVLAHLSTKTSITDWSVSRISHGEQVHLSVEGTGMLHRGQRVPWGETMCKRMIEGAARLVPDTTLDPDYADSPHVPTVRAYASAPLVGGDGEVVGTLCGIAATPLTAANPVDSDLVQLFGRLLSAQLDAARRLDQAAHREHQAMAASETDALTGLLNRRGWDREMVEAQDRLDAFGDRFTVLVCDLDALKQVNDEQGHAAGDALIAAAGGLLRSSVRAADRVARYGGDEFMVLLDGISDEQVDERVRAITGTLSDAGIGASVGGAVARTGVRDLAAAFTLADEQMYRTKRARRSAPVGDIAGGNTAGAPDRDTARSTARHTAGPAGDSLGEPVA